MQIRRNKVDCRSNFEGQRRAAGGLDGPRARRCTCGFGSAKGFDERLISSRADRPGFGTNNIDRWPGCATSSVAALMEGLN